MDETVSRTSSQESDPSTALYTVRAHGRHTSQPPLNMSNMAYYLPGDQAQLPHLEPHVVYQYRLTPHAQGISYSIRSSGYYPLTYCVPYAISYAPVTAHYPSYHLGRAQHSFSPFHGGSLPILNHIGAANANINGDFHYTPTYSGHFGQYKNCDSSKVRTKTRRGCRGGSQRKSNIINKETEQQAKVTYDITKTIVDGSSSSRSALGLSSAIGLGSGLPASMIRTSQRSSEKLKQPGCVLRVDDLPRDANVMELKDHFSQEATDDIKSVFLISKSNCAFVNYRTAHACAAALARFHHSCYHGVRLKCRLRKGFIIPGSEFTIAATTSRQFPEETGPSGERSEMIDSTESPPNEADGHAVNRYFIMKSFTVKDLELSKKSGIWATQSRNEASLTRASETSDNVYLIFSANKSGEYFGYARMMSPLTDKEGITLKIPTCPPPISRSQDDLEIKLTPATVTAPRGLIINDSTRGTVFWKTECSEGENGERYGDKPVEAPDGHVLEARSLGRPFGIEWKSTDRVPFCRTRGLHNPWNANREVKIARDGTEIEPKVGRDLIQLFHQC